MKKQIQGLAGKILKIDLSGPTISHMETEKYAERFLGGRGIATKIYWDEVPPETRAFDPENCLIFMTGALTATGVQGSPRFEVVSKSPMLMPEGFCYGNMGGFFGPYLKKAGYDGVIITGCAEKPSYIYINDDQVEIIDASELWGKGVYDTKDILKEKHGKSVRFLTTGIAGENKCRSATIITDLEGSSTGGFGAVMGSKNLKAVAVNGSGKINVADREELKKLNKYTLHISKRGTLRMPVSKKQMEFVSKAACYQCGIECGRGLYRTVKSNREEVLKCQSMVMYMPFAGGIPGEPIDTSIDATRFCNDYSLCTMEIQNILFFLGSANFTGVLTDEDTGLEYSKLGTREFIEKLVSMIAKREGFGDILAEGILRAGETLGEKAKEQFNEYTYAVGLGAVYSPRQYNINALLYALEPRMPIGMLHDFSHLIARWLLHMIRPHLSPTTSEVFRNAAGKFWGSDKAWDMTTYEGKAIASVKIQNRTFLKDSLGLCDFGWPIMDSFNTEDNTGDPTLESRIFSAVSGLETDIEGLEVYAERIFNLQRAILLREGWKSKDDDTPAEFNFTQPIEFDMLNPQLIVPGPTEEPVSIKGNVLDREKYYQMRKEFYEIRQWDLETGLQKKAPLTRLNLPEITEELEKLKLLKE